jgi:hypothetical protein
VDVHELRRALVATDPAAVLVAPRVLRRVLQAEFRVPYVLLDVPHAQCFPVDRQTLFRHVEQDELELEPDRLLPPTVILLAAPGVEQLQGQKRGAVLLRYWQLLFHAHVHLALDEHRRHGRLGPEELDALVGRIGPTEFEEIRSVLRQENYLLPPADDLATFIEFAAVYLDLKYFRTNLRATYFPAIEDFAAIDALLAGLLDADGLFARTRLPDAPDPVILTDTSSDESQDYYWRLMRQADRTARQGDIVRSAILRTKAARVAPVAWMQETRAKALQDLEVLTRDLREALGFGPEVGAEWLQVLPALLDKADQGNWPVEAKLLYDLQQVCVEHQRKLYALDLVEWVISAGRRPIKRPLASVQLVRTTKHLRSAAQRLTMARVSDDDRQRLGRLLQNALAASEERLRERFRPVLHGAFYDVGLTAANPPERVALHKVVEEILDRITEYGFFTFSDLRDSISRNQLKLADLADPHAFWRGDALLALDRRLSPLMEGVYRRGEFYLRWLESTSSLFFGTGLGRYLTKNVIIPFGGAYALVKGLELCAKDYFNEQLDLPWYSVLALALFFLALIRSARLRGWIVRGWGHVRQGLRLVFHDLPLRLWRLPWVRRVLKSWPLLLCYWYVLKPAAVTALLWLYAPATFGWPPALVGTFIAAAVVLNSRFGVAIGETAVEMVTLLYGWLRFEFFQGLYRLIAQFFKRITAAVESVLYTVDEWLRFRSDESQLTMVLRAVLGVAWFPIGYVIRLYFVTLIEPSLNPIKLPLSSLAMKFMILNIWYAGLVIPPFIGSKALIEDLSGRVGLPLAVTLTAVVIIPTLWLLPSAVAFFLWEMKENWRLFRANRPARLRPVMVGRHGETVRQLLRPGFHSGTIPRLFAHLRKAERNAYRTNNWRAARTYRQALKEVTRSIRVFVEREFISLLRESRHWHDQPVAVGRIIPSCNRIRIELVHAASPDEPMWLALDERGGWLFAGLQEAGWLRHLGPEARQVMAAALAGLYKLAGVELVREQLSAVLRPGFRGLDVTDSHLVLWADSRTGRRAAFDLPDDEQPAEPRAVNGRLNGSPPGEVRGLFFLHIPLTWQQWVEFWEREQARPEPPSLPGDLAKLPLAGTPD